LISPCAGEAVALNTPAEKIYFDINQLIMALAEFADIEMY